jgi:hypothetical protein
MLRHLIRRGAVDEALFVVERVASLDTGRNRLLLARSVLTYIMIMRRPSTASRRPESFTPIFAHVHHDHDTVEDWTFLNGIEWSER